jgi:hypothetical protein
MTGFQDPAVGASGTGTFGAGISSGEGKPGAGLAGAGSGFCCWPPPGVRDLTTLLIQLPEFACGLKPSFFSSV